MTQEIASPRLAGGLAVLCGFAMLPFVWLHLFGGRPKGQSYAAAALAQLHADLAVSSPERWLLLAWPVLPIAWALVGLAYLRTSAAALRKRNAIVLAAVALVLASLTTYCYGAGTAPLFFSVPVLGARLAFRLRTLG